ncbi:MAG TPA: 6-hydroxymethylpterin diphosphokinase MptE-like protein [Kofleriaceae bacterium]|nr:6-hydroxymethylpterin diphosphokinase MptE-like protein [Kofleriaceae bacterium]
MRISEPPPQAENGRIGEPAGGDAPLAEAILSGGWDTERDLVVLVGAAPARAAVELQRLGQQRILWFRTGDDVGTEPPVGVIRVDHLDEVAAAVRALGALGPHRVTGRPLEAVQAQLYTQVIARIERARCQRFLSSEPGGGTAEARTRIEHGLANLPALCRWPGAASIGSLAGAPLIIVAPGPGLQRNVGMLGALRDRAVVLALSHSLAPLQRAGITPDFVLAADGHDVSHHLAEEDLSSLAGMVVTATAHPRLFQTMAPRHMTLREPGPIDSWLIEIASGGSPGASDPTALIPTGGSVAHTALALGLAWGCNPIGFVGLDLSFPGGSYYAEGSRDQDVRAVASADGHSVSLEGWSDAAHRGREPVSERLVQLPGWDGHPLPSSFHFSMCQRWFEETARRMAGTVRLYNCSEGGAYIGGMRHIKLSGLASRLPPPIRFEPTAAASRATGEMDPRSRRRAARERLVELMLELRRCPALSASELAGLVSAVPLLSALVEAELGAAAPGASSSDAERRRAALLRWAVWLEPRVVEAERALAREDRSSETMRLRPMAVAGQGG